MNTIKNSLIAVLFAACSSAFAQAPADAPKGDKGERGDRAHKMHERLKAADKNGDGKISREEANASLPRMAKHFDAIDTNKDGFITREEMKAYHDKNGGGRERKAP